MKIVKLEQGSEEWLSWRKGLLTGTDAPMLLGICPYVTPYKGWQRKKGLIAEVKENDAMRRGKHDEPIAREWFNKEYGLGMEPCCVESEEHNFIGSSLDGLSKCGKYILEIKSNGDHYHNNLEKGIPEFHYAQMQHQFLSTDFEVVKGFYLSWNKENAIIKEVYPDKEWIFDKYLPKAKEFWRKVVFFEAPELCNKDYIDMNDNNSWRHLSKYYIELCEKIAELEERKKSCKEELISICNDSSCSGGGLKVLKRISKGRIDYESIPEIAAIDLEKYRKKEISSWTIILDRK